MNKSRNLFFMLVSQGQPYNQSPNRKPINLWVGGNDEDMKLSLPSL